MSTPNPLAPQGSLLEQQGRGKSTLQIITFIGALHVFFLCGLLWIGCKKDDHPQAAADAAASNPPPAGGAESNSVPPIAAPPVAISPAPVPVPSVVPSNPPTVIAPATSITPVPPVVPGTPAPVEAAPTAGSDYKVQKGDTGVTIARKNNVSLTALKAANPSVKWTALTVDQRIQIPASDAKPTVPNNAPHPTADAPAAASEGVTYEVKPGDTGSKIAHKFGVSWKSIRAANQLTSDVLKPKQKLTIPGKAAGHSTAPAPAPVDASPAAGLPAIQPTATPVASPAPVAPVPLPAPGR